MAQATLTTKQVWSEFRALPRASQEEFIELLAAESDLRAELEDAIDLAIVAERTDEPSRPWDEVMDEIIGR